jgi:small subunit ribosomal protein S1
VRQDEPTLTVPPRKVVKTLHVGQEVQGTVKRVTDFGAFVDIGVGRDGLVHISEMAPGRVGKATDIVKQGDTVTVWIKELDRDKNRISLTMIAPGTPTVRDLEEGAIVTGKVTRLERYGAFVDVGVGRDGMLHVKEMGRSYVEKPEDVVNVGDEIQVQVIGIDRRRGRIDLSMKELLPEVEEASAPQLPAQTQYEPGPAVVEESFVSPFELAFREAEVTRRERSEKRRDRQKKSRPWEYEEDEEEDIIRRTLAHHRKSKGEE